MLSVILTVPVVFNMMVPPPPAPPGASPPASCPMLALPGLMSVPFAPLANIFPPPLISS